jgi:hypothetical protein
MVIHYVAYRNSLDGFSNQSNVHYYWIVSEKRKPYMLQQIRDRKGISEHQITFVPGIFDSTTPTNHPNIPIAWLDTSVTRLLAAHMQALRIFRDTMQFVDNKDTQIFVCMEDDIVLHNKFESMVDQCAVFLREYKTPARIQLGYVNPPMNVSHFKKLGDYSLLKPHNRSGDPWGAQCYMLNYAYCDAALKHYEATYKTAKTPAGINANADAFLFEIPSDYFLLDPPACIEDNPTFGTLMGHGHNAQYYIQMTNKYNVMDYHKFPSSK